MRAALARAVAATALAAAVAGAQPVEGAVEATLAALAGELDARAAAALRRIEGTGRRLLAARAYLRAGTQLGARWSWSAAEAAAFRHSAEKRGLDAAIADVRCVFEARNPHYTLWVNPEFRSLDLQLARWNDNESVRLAREGLLAAVVRARGGTGGEPPRTAALREILLAHVPSPTPTLAAPGLSPHGRLRAVDFQVESAGRIVAGTETAAIATEWVADGWKARLRAAIVAADAGFEGPLEYPDEPWHYEFTAEPGHPARAGGAGCSAG